MKIIALTGHVGYDITARGLRKELDVAGGRPIRVEVNSPGGFVFEGIEIFNLLREYKGNVEIRIMSLAASMMSYISLAGNKITAYNNATFMIHNARTVGIGDHNDMQKVADRLRGISHSILAPETSRKTGKSLDEVKKLMDAETFFFGQELLDAGIVDELIEPDDKSKKKDKAQAITEAQLAVDACYEKMKESAEYKADLMKAAAYFEANTTTESTVGEVSGDATGETDSNTDGNINHKEVSKMTLKEFLAQNSGAKAEYDAEINQAEQRGAKTQKEKTQAMLDKVAPIVASEEYKTPVITTIISAVLKGEKSVEALESATATFDMIKEQNASTEAAGETQTTGETQGQQGSASQTNDDGSIDSQESYNAEIERMKSEMNPV